MKRAPANRGSIYLGLLFLSLVGLAALLILITALLVLLTALIAATALLLVLVVFAGFIVHEEYSKAPPNGGALEKQRFPPSYVPS